MPSPEDREDTERMIHEKADTLAPARFNAHPLTALRNLVRHCWLHSGYPECGYSQMTTEQKRLYCHTVGARFDPLGPRLDA